VITFPLVFRFPNRPRCPVCQRDLNAAAVCFFSDLAFCASCAQWATHESLVLEADFGKFEGHPLHFTRNYKLLFYTPTHDTPTDKSAATLLWSRRSKGSPVPVSWLDHARRFKPGTPKEYLP
jgi:hypothetical protein